MVSKTRIHSHRVSGDHLAIAWAPAEYPPDEGAHGGGQATEPDPERQPLPRRQSQAARQVSGPIKPSSPMSAADCTE